MLVLLPPSEGKTTPRRGAPLDLGALSFPSLTATRERVLDELIAIASGPRADALRALHLSEGQVGELDRDAALLTAPTAKAGSIYTGVLYDALGLATLDAAARRRAQRSLLISSALFGCLRVGDRIPAYRLSGDVSLPRLGALTALWRDPLATAMADLTARGLVVDLRSSTYAGMWKPVGDVARRTVTVRVLQQRPDGTRAVVSHFNKATKGRLVRHWVETGVDAKDAEALAEGCESAGVVAELGPRPSNASPRRLDVIVHEL